MKIRRIEIKDTENLGRIKKLLKDNPELADAFYHLQINDVHKKMSETIEMVEELKRKSLKISFTMEPFYDDAFKLMVELLLKGNYK